MFAAPRAALRDHIRRYLGTNILPRMENTMNEVTDALNRLAAQTNAASAAQAASISNLQNAITQLKSGALDDEQRALVNQIEYSLVKMGEDAAVADDGYEPAETPTTPEQPATPEVPAEPVVDAPVDETPAVDVPEGDNTAEGTAGRTR